MSALAEATQRLGTWITPTLGCLTRWGRAPASDPGVTLHRQLVKALHEAGVGLLMGIEGGPAYYELIAMVHAGLTPYQALRTGTYNVAQYMGLLDSAGTVAVGKRADLVLLTGNPLQDVRHTREPAGVMVAGQWRARAALDQLLLAAPTDWFNAGMWRAERGILPGQQTAFTARRTQFEAVRDSLAAAPAKSSESARLLQRQAEALGAMRALLQPEGQETFDLNIARVWLREQRRQGYRVAIPGVALAASP